MMLIPLVLGAVVGLGVWLTARGVVAAHASKNGNFSYGRASLVSLSLTARSQQGDGSGYFLRNHFDVAKLDGVCTGLPAGDPQRAVCDGLLKPADAAKKNA